MGAIAAVAVGATIIAGGAVAAGAMQSDSTRRANAQSSAATKKYMKLAAAESQRGFETVLGITSGLRSAQGGLSATYQNNTVKTVDDYSDTIDKALGDAPSYNEGVNRVVDQANKNVADLEKRNNEVLKKSADQTYDYNLSRFDDFANFAERMSQRNQEIRLDLARAATPLFDQTRSQIALNDLQGTQGIMSAATESAITRAAAQRGLASGVGAGSQLKTNLELRDIGSYVDAEKNAAAKRFQDRQLLDYNTLVAGTQMGVNDVYNFMGLNVNKVIDVNNENSARLFEAQKVPLNYTMVGLNTTLDKRFDAATNRASFLNTMHSNIYGQESNTARQAAVLDAAAAEARTNQKLGIQGQGLTNAYNNANRSLASGLANAQLVSNASSQIGGSLMGYGMGSMGGGGGGGGGGGLNSAGFYGNQVTAANAYGVAPNQLSYQKSSGGFLGIGGTPGGYYYNA